MKDSTLSKIKNSVSKKSHENVLLSSNNLTTKKLNIIGKIVITCVYTIAVSLFASAHFKKDIESDINRKFSSIKADQIETRSFIKNEFNKAAKDLQYNTSNLNTEDRIIKHINTEFLNSKRLRDSLLKNQQKQINILKEKIQALLQLTENKEYKTVKEKESQKTLTYSNENYDILYFRHQQIIKRRREKNKLKENAFVIVHDMTKKINQTKLQNLKDSLELALYSTRRKLSSKRQQFKKEKFINIASNF